MKHIICHSLEWLGSMEVCTKYNVCSRGRAFSRGPANGIQALLNCLLTKCNMGKQLGKKKLDPQVYPSVKLILIGVP